jgi:hypothetical protein
MKDAFCCYFAGAPKSPAGTIVSLVFNMGPEQLPAPARRKQLRAGALRRRALAQARPQASAAGVAAGGARLHASWGHSAAARQAACMQAV